MHKKIAMMGGKHSVLPFKGIGIDVFPIFNIEQAKTTLEKLASEYGVIFITERVAEQMLETIAQYDEMITPTIIFIPSSTGAIGLGQKWIDTYMEKAVGR